MAVKILIMGLPTSGKSNLSRQLQQKIQKHGSCDWINADTVRSQFNDWDFSVEGRMRQSRRMSELADTAKVDFVILDFVCPLRQAQEEINADWVIWMDTVKSSPYADTNFVFQSPQKYDFHITSKSEKNWADIICKNVVSNIRQPQFDSRNKTTQMLGRFQPWHRGHTELFKKALEKTGQVAIMVRDCHDVRSNPFTFDEVEARIRHALDEDYQGFFEVFKVPNITHITYGRDVGYSIQQEFLGKDIEEISATEIRKAITDVSAREKHSNINDT